MSNQFSHGRALVIAVAQYRSVSVLPQSVINDARDISALLESPEHCGYSPGHVDMLLDDQATASGIREGLHRLAKSAKKEDTVVVFFSGHGARLERGKEEGSYLVPFDCDPDRLRETAIHADEFTTLLKAIKSERLVVLVDACHSGGVSDIKGTDETLGLKRGLDERTYSLLAEGVGRVVMASSRSNEVSLVLSGDRNSLFTRYLLEGLRGASVVRNDGLVRVFDLFHYVSDKVPSRAAQHPIFKAQDLENNFALALNQGGKSVSTPHQIPELESRPAKFGGKTRLGIRNGLITRWNDLALYFDIPLADRSTFGQGKEAAGKLLDWLDERQRLSALRDAFQYLAMDDLISLLDADPPYGPANPHKLPAPRFEIVRLSRGLRNQICRSGCGTKSAR